MTEETKLEEVIRLGREAHEYRISRMRQARQQRYEEIQAERAAKGWKRFERREWTDHEPDTFSVELLKPSHESPAAVVVSGCATYLTPEQALDAGAYISTLASKAKWINAGLRYEDY